MEKQIKKLNLELKIKNKEKVEFTTVLKDILLYMDNDYPCELIKHGYTSNFAANFIEKYHNCNWYSCEVSLKDLAYVHLASVGWIRKLACLYKNCIEYDQTDDCIYCNNPKMQWIYLQDVINGFKYDKSPFAKKISSIIDRIDNNETSFLFSTLIRDKFGYRVYDGNSRLISYAIWNNENQSNKSLKCYIGEVGEI